MGLLRSNKVPEQSEGFLSTSIKGDANGIRQGELVVVRGGKLALKLRLGNPIVREEAKVLKPLSLEALNLLNDELEGAEIFVRVRATGTSREGNFAFIIPPDERSGLEIYRGKTETEATRKARSSGRALNGALFKAIDDNTVAEIIGESQTSETADQA